MDPKNRGLGRGLNALFEDEESFSEAAENTQVEPVDVNTEGAGNGSGNSRLMLGVDQLVQGKSQPRHVFDKDSLSELSESIKNHGLLQPILVRPSQNQDGLYEIIAGERRWRAAQMAQKHEVPVIIKDFSDVESLEVALIENLQREDLNPVDEAMGYRRLMDEHSYTQEQLAQAMGKSRSHVANMVRLLGLPDVVLGHLERGDLTMGHARTLVGHNNAVVLAKEIIAKKLNVRQAELLAAGEPTRASGSSKSKSGTRAHQAKGADTIAIEKELSNHLGMRVHIETKDGEKGSIAVEWKSLDQLDEVLKKLSD